ncbi:MAG: HAMP domain-containing protein [Microthrixaceae bacterium]
MRPLDRVRSIKVKLSLVIVAAVAITAVVSVVGFRTGIPVLARPLIAATIALVLVYPFARGLTSPLREMAAAARAMADGDYQHPLTSTSADEVGELARAFDAMRASWRRSTGSVATWWPTCPTSCAPPWPACRPGSRTSPTASSWPIRPTSRRRSPRSGG